MTNQSSEMLWRKEVFNIRRCSRHSLQAFSLLKSLYKMADRWYFTRERIRNCPSVRDGGIDCAKELGYRQQCANFIQDIGQRLSVYVPFPVLHKEINLWSPPNVGLFLHCGAMSMIEWVYFVIYLCLFSWILWN